MDRSIKLPARSWRAWIGTIPQVKRLHAQVKALAAQRRDARLASLGPDPELVADSLETKWERERLAERRSEIEAAYRVVVRLKTEDETIEGDWDEVMMEFDSRTYSELRIACEHYRSDDLVAVTIAPARAPGLMTPGVTLQVQGTDRGWALQAQAQLSEEIDRGTPSWGWLHSPAASVALGIAIYAAIVLPVLILVLKREFSWELIAVWVATILLGMAAQLAATRRDRLIRRLLPPVEILYEGQDSSGSRAIGFVIGVIVIPVLLTVLAAIWS